jgi:hypothetical protein
MELKKTNHLLSAADIDVVKSSGRNNSDRGRIYEMFFSAEKDEADNSIDSNHSDTNREGRKFSNVSTLDWLQTWRSTAIS